MLNYICRAERDRIVNSLQSREIENEQQHIAEPTKIKQLVVYKYEMDIRTKQLHVAFFPPTYLCSVFFKINSCCFDTKG